MGQDIFDLVIVVTLVIFTLRGVSNGFVVEVAGILSLVGGFWAARSFNASLAPHLTFIDSPDLRYIVACTILFVGVMVIIGLIARVLKKIIAFSFASWADRIAGAGLGLVKGILLWALILIILDKIVGDAPFMKDSRAVPYFSSIIDWLSQWLPPEIASRVSITKG